MGPPPARAVRKCIGNGNNNNNNNNNNKLTIPIIEGVSLLHSIPLTTANNSNTEGMGMPLVKQGKRGM